MTRLLATLTTAVVAVLVAPGASNAQVPALDSVTGGAGLLCVPFPECGDVLDGSIGLDAQSGPSGENPTGTVSGFFGQAGHGSSLNADVTCLSVSGNSAIIGFSGTTTSVFSSFWIAGLIRVVDGVGTGAADTFEFAAETRERGFFPPFPPPLPGPTECSSYPASFPNRSRVYMTTGGIVVTDVQPFPTSKEQCKNGGWRRFPGFKSQGDCLSFVATHGRNPPAGP